MKVKGYCPRKQQSFSVEISVELAKKYPATAAYSRSFPDRQVEGIAFDLSDLLKGEGLISSDPLSAGGNFATWKIYA